MKRQCLFRGMFEYVRRPRLILEIRIVSKAVRLESKPSIDLPINDFDRYFQH